MEGSEVLERFFTKAMCDPVIDAKHISLFMALYNLWQSSGFQEKVTIHSNTILPMAKISSRATYHDKLGYLVKEGYLRYLPSHYGKRGSTIFMNLEK